MKQMSATTRGTLLGAIFLVAGVAFSVLRFATSNGSSDWSFFASWVLVGAGISFFASLAYRKDVRDHR